MSVFTRKATVDKSGILVLKDLPLPPGTEVEVTVASPEEKPPRFKFRYAGMIDESNWDPFAPACPLEDWEALRDPA